MNFYRRARYLNQFSSIYTYCTSTASRTCTEEAISVGGLMPSLLNDKLRNHANIDLILKLWKKNHPLFSEIKENFNKPSIKYDLIIKLLSKMAGLNGQFNLSDVDLGLGILHKQRILAEVTELLRTSILIHKGILTTENVKSDNTLTYGNKISLLSGDYLFSKVFHDLSHMKNSNLFGMVSTAFRDLTEAEFLPQLPGKPRISKDTGLLNENNLDFGPYEVDEIMGNSKHEWVLRNLLGSANLLGKSCQGVLLLAEHDQFLQDQGYLFGKNLALAWQANLDFETFNSEEFHSFNLLTLPIMLHLEKDIDLYKDLENGSMGICDFNKIKDKVRKGNALSDAKRLQEMFANRALASLKYFDNNSAKESLNKLLLLFKV